VGRNHDRPRGHLLSVPGENQWPSTGSFAWPPSRGFDGYAEASSRLVIAGSGPDVDNGLSVAKGGADGASDARISPTGGGIPRGDRVVEAQILHQLQFGVSPFGLHLS
jgi:hypothetical protein